MAADRQLDLADGDVADLLALMADRAVVRSERDPMDLRLEQAAQAGPGSLASAAGAIKPSSGKARAHPLSALSAL